MGRLRRALSSGLELYASRLVVGGPVRGAVDQLAGLHRAAYGHHGEAGVQAVPGRHREGPFAVEGGGEVEGHGLVGAVVGVGGEAAVVDPLRLAAVQGAADHQTVAHQVGDQRALGAGEVPAPFGQRDMAVGVERELEAALVFDDGGLVVGQVHVRLEGVVGRAPAGVAQGVSGRAVFVGARRVGAVRRENAPHTYE